MISLLEMAEKHIIVGDGATGTVLHQLIPRRNALDLVPLSNPDELLKLHLDYINAGAMVIQTHTFGTSRPRLAKKNMEDRFEEVNAKAVKIARDARDVAGKDILIAGSIGPHLQPTQDPQSAICEIFCDQAVILDERGVDFILLETLTHNFIMYFITHLPFLIGKFPKSAKLNQ